MVKEHALKAGFKLKRRQSLQRHYAKTLDIWAAALEAHKSEAIAIQSEEVYERYMKYLTGCAELFRKGYTRHVSVHAGKEIATLRILRITL